MNVTVNRKLIDKFRRRAKAVFPKEKFAFLSGRRNAPDEIVILDLIFPEQAATVSEVSVSHEEFTKAMEVAAGMKQILLGSIHSHPFPHDIFRGIGVEPILSIGDTLSWGDTDIVNGVMSITETAEGKKITEYCFWEQPLLCGVRVI